jgi:hypothetical protein
MIAKQEEAKRKEEEEKKAQEEKLLSDAKEYIDRAEHVITLVDKAAMQRVLDLAKELEPGSFNKLQQTPKVNINYYNNSRREKYINIDIYFYDFLIRVYNSGNKHIPTEQEIVDDFNSSVLNEIRR